MPKYFLGIVEAEAPYDEGGEAVFGQVMAAHEAFSTAVKEAGCSVISGEALRPAKTATFLRGTRSAEVSTVDNPLPEVKEVFGGYYVIEAPDDETALKVAKECPAFFGYIEVRPVWEFN